MKNALFEGFQPQSVEIWTEQLKKDLRGEPLDRLMWKTQGISGKPFYTAEDLDFEVFNYNNFSDNSGLLGDRFWVNYQPIKVEDFKAANQKALDALANGANGILFELTSTPDLEILLKDIQPEYCHLSFKLHSSLEAKGFAELYQSYLKAKGVGKVSGYMAGQSHSLSKIEGLRTLGIEVPKENHTALELALAMSNAIEAIDHFTEAGASAEECLHQVFFKVSITNDFFLEIARHRALRRLFSAIVSAYGIKQANLEIVSQAGPWEADIDDPHSFMLHATTQAMSAILGGTDALIVQPFYNVFPTKTSLAERIARNISSILSEESYLNKMVDPAAGSYYIEHLTNTLYNDALALLKKIEATGGISKIEVAQLKRELK